MRAFLPLFLLPFAGCLVLQDEPIDPATIVVPDGLGVSDGTYRAAYLYAASHVGRADFDRLYRVNRSLTGPAHVTECGDCSVLARVPHDFVAFDVVTPLGPWDQASVAVWPENLTIANDLDEQPYYGFPDCRQRPASCDFRIDEGEARRIAQRHGLEPRGCPLRALTGWSADKQRFTWQVTDESCPGGTENGHGLLIDVATGRVIDDFDWTLIVD